MENNLTLLKDGKILYWGEQFPRFYKLDGEKLLWSDNLRDWNVSQASLHFILESDLKEYK